MMKITFQRCTAKDLDLLDQMYIESSIDEGRLQFPKVSKEEMYKQLNMYKKDRRKGFLSELKKPKTHLWYFVKAEGEIAGFAHAELLKKYNFAKLGAIYVKRKYRRTGIGKKLIDFILKKLKENKIKSVESGIFVKNKPSINLHEKLGFKQVVVKYRKDL